MPHVHPTRDDPVVASLSEVVGGPVGDRAGVHWWWNPVRVLLLLTAVGFALGIVQKAPCSLSEGHDQNWVYSHMCYTDLRPLYVPRGLAEHAWPYTDDPQTRARYDVMEYPVGIAYWAWGASWVTHWLNGSPDLDELYQTSVDRLGTLPEVQDETSIFVLVNAVGFGALALLSVWLLARVDPRRPWDAAAFAVSPALVLTGLINWDLIAVALVGGALWAWARGRPVLTGVLIGLGTAAKLYPLFLLGGVLVLCLRQRRYAAGVLAFVWAGVAWLLANAPALITGREQWKVFWEFNSGRSADLGSVWLVIDQAANVSISAHTINVWSWALFGAWCVGVFALGMLARRRTGAPDPRLAQLGFLIVAGFLLVNKVYSPQYVLWLLPLAALARPRWRDQIVWQAGELFYFFCVWWYLGGYLDPTGGGDVGFYWVAIAVRVVAELYLVGIVVRDILRPEADVVVEEAVAGPDPSQPAMMIRSNVVAV